MELTINIIPMSYYIYLSQNRYRKYISVRGREYKNIIENCLVSEMLGKEILTGDVKVSLVFYHPTRRKLDLDNNIKPILDFLSNIVYEDDKQVVELTAKKHYDKENPRIYIKIENAS